MKNTLIHGDFDLKVKKNNKLLIIINLCIHNFFFNNPEILVDLTTY